MAERSLVLVYYNGSITTSEDTVIFFSDDQACFYIENDISLENLKRIIEENIGMVDGQKVSHIKYRLPISSSHDKICYRVFKLRNDRNVQMMFECHQTFPDIQVIELYVELGIATSTGISSQHEINRDDNIPHNMRWETTSSAQPGNEFGEYGSSSGDDHDDDNYTENSEASAEDLDLENCNVEDVARQSLEMPMSPFEPPAHMRALNLEAMSAPEFPEYPSLYVNTFRGVMADGELHVGMQFRNKDDAITTIKHYCLQKSVDYKVIESDPTRYSGRCKSYGDGCSWRVRASYSKRKHIWEITKYNGPHTCASAMISQDHSKLDSNMICRQIEALVKEKPSINVSVLIAEIRNQYGYTPTYRKAWIAKQKAIEAAFGNWEESYNELPKWLSALQQFLPGTIIDLQTQPAYDGNHLVRDTHVFHRLFWSFPSCIEAFKYCKPVVQIDGTHLYGKYKGTLLMAIAQDGNKNILPIAFAIVESETLNAWRFFLEHLRANVTPQEGICFISDRHESIKGAFRAIGHRMNPPHAYHVYCIRHISANFMRRFKNKEMQRIVVNIGKL